MSLLVASNLSKVYGGDEIFSGISVDIPHKARIAIVGPNGAGKTTLISLLLGLDHPTEGTVSTAKGVRMAFLPQRPEMAGGHTLWQEQMKAFAPLRRMEAELHALAEALADPAQHDRVADDYARKQTEFELAGGYTYETRARMVLTGVGFSVADDNTPLSQLSGGQKTRAMLARLLLEAPDILILDEPTNHLDIQAVEWLENFLQSFEGAVVAVSHDRYFIDHFATTVWEMEFGRLETYKGNYTHYLRQREERRERLQKEYEAQQAFVSKEMDYIRKHMGSRWTAQAKGRLKKLNTMEKRGKLHAHGALERRTMRLQLQTANRSGDIVLKTKELAVGYPDDAQPLFRVPNMTLWRGETAAVIGPNGAGKSTLLKTLIGQLAPLEGSATLGASVKIGYFAQAHELLDPNSTIIDEIMRAKPMPQSEARNYLGAFMFSNDDVFRTIGSLSGGERGRVALAKLALGGANLLLLDEPTNHLDIDSQEILQEVLENYDGTILLVSHDRYLISALATQIWAVGKGRDALEVFDGTYEEYVTARNQRQSQEASKEAPKANAKASKESPTAHPSGLNAYQRKKRLEALEAQIARDEAEHARIARALEEATTRGDLAQVSELGARYNALEATLAQSLEEWATLAE